MTLRCLTEAPDTFHAGVSVAPVTDWDGYDTCYTERYMGTPANNPEGYRDSSVLTARRAAPRRRCSSSTACSTRTSTSATPPG